MVQRLTVYVDAFYSSIASHRIQPSPIFCKTDQIQMIVVVGEDRFSFVAKTQEELDVSWSPKHGAGIEFMCIGFSLFNGLD